jgi:prepilin-type N-terminal cleavage/methylation domain-containing protein
MGGVKVLNLKKNRTKGFTLIEIVVALGILVLMGAFTIGTISAISHAKMKEHAQVIKSEFELTRNFAKTHGGDAVFSITKVDEGLLIERTGENLTTEEQLLKDRNLELFYQKTDDSTRYQLGQDDAQTTLQMTFSQTHGAIVGPDMLDYILISNGSRDFMLIIEQKSGMIYYDYEIQEDNLNKPKESGDPIRLPKFRDKDGLLKDRVSVEYTGKSIQPELVYDSRYVKISGVYRAVDGGPHTIVFTLKDPYSTKWEDNSTREIHLIWDIE